MHPHRRTAFTEDPPVIDQTGDTYHLHEAVECQLLSAARVGDDRLGASLLDRVYESDTPAPWHRHPVDRVGDEGRTLGVEEPDQPRHAVVLGDQAEVAAVAKQRLAIGHPGFVEFVAHLTGPCGGLLGPKIHGRFGQPLGGRGQVVDRHVIGRSTEARPDRCRRADGDLAGDDPVDDRREPRLAPANDSPTDTIARASGADMPASCATSLSGVRAPTR